MAQLTAKGAKTKKAIRDIFFSQLTQRKLNSITIRQIADLAGLNRSTFYLYYNDLNDLLEVTKLEIIEKVEHQMRRVIPLVLTGKIAEAKKALKGSLLNEYSLYLKGLLSPTGDPSFVYQLKKLCKMIIWEEAGDIPKTRELDYIFEFTSAAQVALFSKWILEDMDLSVDELIDLMYRMLLQGPLSVGIHNLIQGTIMKY